MNFAALRYEELSLNTFPSLHTQVYDGWILRFREDGDWHDSCVLPLYLSTRSYEDKIDFCEKKFAARSLPCAFKMTSNVPSALDQQLEQRGYALMGKTRVLECRAGGLTVHLECGEKKDVMHYVAEEKTINSAAEISAGIAGDNFENMALAMGKTFLHYNRPRSIVQLYQRIDRLTANELHQVACELFTPENLTTLIYK